MVPVDDDGRNGLDRVGMWRVQSEGRSGSTHPVGVSPLRKAAVRRTQRADRRRRLQRAVGPRRHRRQPLLGLPGPASSAGAEDGTRSTVIAVSLTPAEIEVGVATDVSLGISNSGTDTCTNIVLRLDFPVQVRHLRGHSRVDVVRLAPG